MCKAFLEKKVLAGKNKQSKTLSILQFALLGSNQVHSIEEARWHNAEIYINL